MAHSPICSVPNCGKPHSGRGYCSVHYQRWRRHGDPLLGKDAKTPSGVVLEYFRTTVIRLDSDDCLLWPFSRDGFGYAQMGWDGRPRRVHQILCRMVHGEPPTSKHEAAHACGRGHEGCVNKRHLRWDTRLGNQSDRKMHGTHITGERHGMSKLIAPQVLEIRALKGKEPLECTAKRFGIGKQHANDIQNRKRWRHLP